MFLKRYHSSHERYGMIGEQSVAKKVCGPELFQFVIWVVCLSPIWGTLLWHLWEQSVAPLLIPASEIKELAGKLMAEHGPCAEEIAFIEEGRAWSRCETFQ